MTVPDAPRAIDVPLTVTLLFVNAALAIPDNVPPSVRLPVVVTVPERVRPLTVPVPPTDVTVPVLVVYPAGLVVG